MRKGVEIRMEGTQRTSRTAKKTQEHELKRGHSLSTALYESVKEKIIHGELKAGSVILERGLSEEFGVSRTPVREALKRLSQEGWISWEERQRAVVSEITVPAILELFKIREMIEPFAVTEAIDSNMAQLLAGQLAAANMKMAAAKDSPVEFMKCDMEFHTTLVKSLGISMLTPLWQKVREDMTRLVEHSIFPQRSPEVIINEHKELMDALWHLDREKAVSCVREHFSVTINYVRQKGEDIL